jgi:hypothetical protein
MRLIAHSHSSNTTGGSEAIKASGASHYNMEKPKTNLEKINSILHEGGYELRSVTIKPGSVMTREELEKELLEVLVCFKNGQCRLANDERL